MFVLLPPPSLPKITLTAILPLASSVPLTLSPLCHFSPLSLSFIPLCFRVHLIQLIRQVVSVNESNHISPYHSRGHSNVSGRVTILFLLVDFPRCFIQKVPDIASFPSPPLILPFKSPLQSAMARSLRNRPQSLMDEDPEEQMERVLAESAREWEEQEARKELAKKGQLKLYAHQAISQSKDDARWDSLGQLLGSVT